LDPTSPPEQLIGFVLAALPAAIVSVFGTASAALGALSNHRKTALRETLEGPERAALDRYLAHGLVIESRWLVLRVVGIATSAGLIVRELGSSVSGWAPLFASLAAVLAYGIPAEVLRGVILRAPERAALLSLRYLRPIELLAAPLAAPLSFLGRIANKKVVVNPHTLPPPSVTETEVEFLVNASEATGALDHEQSQMIRNVLDFRGLTAGEAMVPRTRVTAFDVETLPSELMRNIAESGHSRYPVYRDRIDNVIGILHAKDLLAYAASHESVDSLDLQSILRRPVAFVPETHQASKVLKDMRAGRHHMAVVIDEFGGMSGIVTLEDLIEEIVGDIQDEHDVSEPDLLHVGEDGSVTVDASIPIAELSRHLGSDFPESDAVTLNGFLMERAGRVPAKGSTLTAEGFDFHVREADERRVLTVQVAPKKTSDKPKSKTKTSAVSAA
jgi:CBS domain containing-hemolysin-like protein